MDDVKHGATKEHFVSAYDQRPPPWDIGRPQAALVRLFDELALRQGTLLDLGCGSGEHVLDLARRGVRVTGIDSTASAIRLATNKARAAGSEVQQNVQLIEGDALDLVSRGCTYDVVLDCGLFHVIREPDRLRYVSEVRAVLTPGGLFVMLGFATNVTDRGPRGYSAAELRSYFADGFVERLIREATFEVNDRKTGMPALLSVFSRIA